MDYVKPKLSLKGPVFSLDVECVAIGKTHCKKDRYPSKFALVDEAGRSICTCLIKPAKPVVSYLTPLTGLRISNFSANDPDLPSAIELLKQHLPKEAILVGQNIDHDIEWMHLTEGKDFQNSIDLAEVFKGWNSKYNHISYHSLLHEAQHVLKISTIDASKEHDPALDATLSVQLWNKVKEDPSKLPQYQQMLIRNRPSQSVAKRLDWRYEGVCLSKFNASKCICGMPTDS